MTEVFEFCDHLLWMGPALSGWWPTYFGWSIQFGWCCPSLVYLKDVCHQGWKKLRSLRYRISDNSYLVRQMRLDPGEVPLLVRQIWPEWRPGYSFEICLCLVKTEMDNKHQITQDYIMSNFVSIVKTIKQALFWFFWFDNSLIIPLGFWALPSTYTK